MQVDEAAKLHEEWIAKGSPECDHPDIVREFYLGSHTGDRVCTTCGLTFTSQEWRALGRSPLNPS